MVDGQIKAGDVTVARPSSQGPYLIRRVVAANHAEYLGNDAILEVALRRRAIHCGPRGLDL